MALCPTSRQWDCSGEQQPDTLREASANDRRIHRGKTSSVLQLFINVKYWWVTKTTWLFLGPGYPENPCVSVDTSPRDFESQAPLEQAHILHSPWAPASAYTVACQQPPSPALFVPEGFAWVLCTQSFLYALKFQFSVEFLTWEMFMWMFLKPSACVEISGAPVITASLGWESAEQRCSWPKCYMWKPIPSLIFAVLVSLCLLLVLMKSHCFQKSLLSIFEKKKNFYRWILGLP